MSELIRDEIGGYYDTIVVESAGYTYIATAPIGTLRTEPKWRVKRVKEAGGETQIVWADDHPGFVHVATNITSLNFRNI